VVDTYEVSSPSPEGASIGHASKRPLTILTAIMAVGTLFLLAASLNNLEFRPGQSFVLPQQPEAPIANPIIGFPAFLFDLFLLLLGIAFWSPWLCYCGRPKTAAYCSRT